MPNTAWKKHRKGESRWNDFTKKNQSMQLISLRRINYTTRRTNLTEKNQCSLQLEGLISLKAWKYTGRNNSENSKYATGSSRTSLKKSDMLLDGQYLFVKILYIISQ